MILGAVMSFFFLLVPWLFARSRLLAEVISLDTSRE